MTTTQTVAAILCDRATATPDAVAIEIAGGAKLRFGPWEARSNAVARGLYDRGVSPGDAVALIFDTARFDELAIAWAAVAKAGGVAVPLGPGWQGLDLLRVLDHAGAVGVIAACPVPPSRARWHVSLAELEEGRRSRPLPAVAQADPFERCYRLAIMAPPTPLPGRSAPGDETGTWAPAADGGLVHVFPVGSPAAQEALAIALRARRPIIAVRGTRPQELASAVAAHQPAVVGLTPEVVAVLVEIDDVDGLSSCVRVLVGGGLGPVSATAVAQLSTRLVPAQVVALGGPDPGEGAGPDGDEPLPLAATSQAGYVWREQLAPGSGNDPPLAYRLRGPLQVTALEAALAQVERRHDALRSRFRTKAGQATQSFDPPGRFDLVLVDLADLPPDEAARELRRRVIEAAAVPVDLVSGPMFAPVLVRLDPGEHVLVVPVHHAVWDDWSLGIFCRELGALYNELAAGRSSSLAEPEAQFGDFVRWQRERLAGDVGVRQRRYWEDQLAGAPLTLDLPIDDPDVPSGTPHRSVAPVRRVLPAQLMAGVRALAQHHQATAFMAVLAGFAAAVSHAAGQDDLLLPTGAANRSRRRFHGTLGCFVKNLPLRVDLSGDPPFGELLERVSRVVLAGLSHQDLPYDVMLRDFLGPPAIAHGLVPRPLVMFQSLRAPTAAPALDGLEVDLVDTSAGDAERAGFLAGGAAAPTGAPASPAWGPGLYRGTVLVVSLIEGDADATLLAEGAFWPPAVERLLDNCIALLTQAVAHPDRPRSELTRRLPALDGRSGGTPGAVDERECRPTFRGYAVDTDAMERVLTTHPGVGAVRVGPRGAGPSRRLEAEVEGTGTADLPTRRELRRHLWSRLPGYAWPAAAPGLADGGASVEERLLARLWVEAEGGEDHGSLTTDSRNTRPLDPGPLNYWLSFSFLEAIAHARQAGLVVTNRQIVAHRTIENLALALDL